MLKFEELPEVNSPRWLSLEDLPGEVWKPVPGFENLLLVSCYSRVLKLPRVHSTNKMILRQNIANKRYYMIQMTVNRKHVAMYVHRIVAMAFLDNTDNKPAVDHIDTNKLNNVLYNLKWATHVENQNNILTKQHISEGQASPNHFTPRKRVAQIDNAGNTVNVFRSVVEASMITGINKQSIYIVAGKQKIKDKNGSRYERRIAGGYKWRYV